MQHFIEYEGQVIEVEIVEEPKCSDAAFVRAVNGYPFQLSHGFGEYITKKLPHPTYWYSHLWVNKCEIMKQ